MQARRSLRKWVSKSCAIGAVTIMLSASSVSASAELAKDQVDSGITHALAAERAERVSHLHYALQFKLRAHAESIPGEEVLRFTLRSGATQANLPLDYRDGTISSATLNGVALDPELINGHLILPSQLLHAGKNKLEISFASRIANAGAAITRYEDRDDGSEYLYSLFVPMDASMAFPCFDQPDLKAGFQLTLDAPSEWKVIGNTASESTRQDSTSTVTQFAETRPISTYLFAFAAGPWTNVHPVAGSPDVYVRRSQLKRAEPEVPQLQEITTRGMKWLSEYFQQPFPFSKYDIVLVPGFPFGGMEHAGETFLREDSVLFRTAPTESDRFQRNILTLHELTHQWFGNLVTMRWFDDLWLKEGFAQYMAYLSLDSLEPKALAWKHFYEDIKPQAYGIDETEGTTPIFQNIPNLKDAKSAYGAIVYQKAPAILKQLEFQLGANAFRNGLRIYLKQHAYANAQWSDLIGAFQIASGQDVHTWADAWVLWRGMPEVDVSYHCDMQGRLTELKLTQKDVLPDGYLWPISNEVWLGYGESGHAPVRHRANWSTSEYVVSEAVGEECPEEVFSNYGDQAYGRFLLDEKSRTFIQQTILAGGLRADDTDPLLRSQLWGALWDGVHVAQSPPRAYVELALANLPQEQDETLARIQGGHATTAIQRYISTQARVPLATRMEEVVTQRMLTAQTTGLRIVSFRTLIAVTETDAGRATLKKLLRGKLAVPDVELRSLDRWNLVEKLISLNDSEAAALFAEESKRDQTGDGQKYAWAVQAAVPDSATKDRYFAQYMLTPTSAEAKPEDWLTQSLRSFNAWNQSDLTEPFLARALDQLPEIKRDRKIFFLGAWLGTFLGGQVSPVAEAVVKRWLSQPDIDPDLRLKVLENADELERTVRIRQRFPE